MPSVTEELPAIIGKPMEWMLAVMKLIVTVSGFVMAFTFGLVVIIRYGFGGDLFAYEEWLLAISIIGFFAGAVLASERKLHINADILGIVIKDPKKAWWRDFVVQLIELLVILFICYACFVSILDDFAFPRLRATRSCAFPSSLGGSPSWSHSVSWPCFRLPISTCISARGLGFP